jgi:hypothetical protein
MIHGVRGIGQDVPVKLSARIFVALIVAALVGLAVAGGASSVAGAVMSASATWKGEFTRDVTGFRHAAKGKAALVKTPPMFTQQFQDFNVYSGELRAESRQLEGLTPPASCDLVEKETVKVLRRMSRYAYGLGDAKDLTPSEYEVRSRQLLSLPARLTSAIAEAQAC